MPELIYTGLTPWYYPATRDAKGIPLGDVRPGDIRELDEAPDLRWRPVDQGRVADGAAGDSEQDKPRGSGAPVESDGGPPALPAPGPPQPVPAPPAVIPASA